MFPPSISKQTVARWLMAFISPWPFAGFRHVPRYLADWRHYRKLSSDETVRWRDSYPCLTDRTGQTPFDPHYFYQSTWVSRHLARTRPDSHIDIGSSVDMLSTLSAFLPIIFVDLRPLHSNVPGLRCVGGDILRLPLADRSVESLSCLHVMEHVGLGRYGDPLNPRGSRLAAAELQRIIAPGGVLYLSVPVGRERVCFNAHRVLAANTVLSLFNELTLESFSLVDDDGVYMDGVAPSSSEGLEYGCGLFTFFRKV